MKVFTSTVWQILSAVAICVLIESQLVASTFSFPPTANGTVTAAAVTEASGIVASLDNPGVLWIHNDSGDTNRIFAINTTGQLLGTYTLTGAVANDWEDIAVGPGPEPGVNYLYLMNSATGGVNSGTSLLARIPEPTVYATQQVGSPISKSLPGAQSQTFNWATSGMGWTTPDAETMFVDHQNGDIILGSKQSGITHFYMGTQAQFSAVGSQNLSFVADAAISRSNGGDISPNDREILIRNGGSFAWLYHRAPGQTIAQALATAPDFPTVNGQSVEPNSEAIGYDANGVNFYTISEGRGAPLPAPQNGPILYQYDRTSGDGPPIPTVLVSPTATWTYNSGASPGAGWNFPGFNDSLWSSGIGPFGYGQGQENVLLPTGSAAYEFRTTFNVTDPSLFGNMLLKLLVDDGAAVYLNGVEINRFNLAPGATLNDFSLSGVADALQNSWRTFSISPGLLQIGTNTLAVESHRFSSGDTDLRFGAQLLAVVPEPGSIVMASFGLISLAFYGWRRRRAAG